MSPLSSPKATQSPKNDFDLNAIWINSGHLRSFWYLFHVGMYWYNLNILKTLRVQFILFPLRDVGLKLPTSSLLENLKRLRQSLMSGEASRPERTHGCLTIDALVMIATSLCFAKVVRNNFSSVTVSLTTSFQQILALSIHFCRFLPFCTPGNPPLSARPAEQLLALAQEPKLQGDQAWHKKAWGSVAMPRKIAVGNFSKTYQNWEDLCHYVWSILHYYMSMNLCRETSFPRIPPPVDWAGWSEWHHWGKSSPHLGAVFGQFLAPAHFKAWA